VPVQRARQTAACHSTSQSSSSESVVAVPAPADTLASPLPG
jgi:hypothetical protein